MIKILIDAMGGDNAPEAIINGSLRAAGEFGDIHLVFAGKRSIIEDTIAKSGREAKEYSILEADEVIENEESPVTAVRRKKDSSIVKGMAAVAAGDADGFVSAGSTGAVLAASTLILKRAEGIYRPALAPVLPTAKEGVLLIDCGANVDCKPEYLAQFGVMGSAYMNKVMGVGKPRVGLINNGAEAGKGNALTKEAYYLLEKMPLHFTGNIEGRYITGGDFDVAVCDGFVGNTVMKFMEGMAATIFGMLKNEFTANTRSKMGALLLKPALKSFSKSTDYTEYGGAPLLGVNSPVVKAHGSSNEKAFYHAIRQCRDMIKNDVTGTINNAISSVNWEGIL